MIKRIFFCFNAAFICTRMQISWHIGLCGYRVLVGKREGRRPLGRPRRRWEDIIKVDLREVEWGTGWIDLAQDRDRWRAVVNAVMNLRFP
jgi:hypothetical protein